MPNRPALFTRRTATVVVIPLVATAAICVVLLAFTWTTLVGKPRQAAVAITGQPQLVAQAETAIGSRSAASINLVPVADRAAAVSSIRDRDTIGAIVLDPDHPEVLTASAAGSAEQQVMTQLAAGLRTQLQHPQPGQAAGKASAPLTVTDVVPLSTDDPTGARLAIAGLPLSIGGVLGGVLLASTLRDVRHQLIGLAGYSIAAGLALAAILGPWYGALHGSYIACAGALAVILMSIASVVTGFRRLVGQAGFGIAAPLFILGAMPMSGTMVPRDFLPQPWNEISGWFPQGAGNTLLRTLSYFPDAPTTSGWVVPSVWVGIGVGLILLSLRRHPAASEARQGATAHTPAAALN